MNSPVTLPRLRTVARVESRQVIESVAGRRRVSFFEVSLLAVWREALMTLAAQAPLILPLVLVLAGVHMTVTFAGLGQSPAQPVPAGGVLEMLIQTAIYAALTWIGLQGTRPAPITGQRLYRALSARWLILLPSALVSGALRLAITLGLATLPWDIVDGLTSRLSMPGTATAGTSVRQIAIRDATVKVFYTLIPNPGLPFPNPLEWHGMVLTVPDVSACAVYSHPDVDPWRPCGDALQRRLRIDQLGGLVLLVAADILLRFRMVIFLLPVGARRRGRLQVPMLGLLRPLAESVGMVLRHRLVVGLHVWVVRLAITCMGALFIVLPSILVQWPVVPNPLPGALGYHTAYLLVNVLSSTATTLISALAVAFSTLYDARLFVSLSRFAR